MIRTSLALAKSVLAAEKMRFLIAGGLNTLVGFTSYPILLWTVPFFRVHYMTGVVLIQFVCTLFAYFTYRTIAFPAARPSVQGFMRFCSFYVTSYVLNWLTLPVLVEIVHLDPIVAQLGFATLLTLTSYFWHSRVSFVGQPPL